MTADLQMERLHELYIFYLFRVTLMHSLRASPVARALKRSELLSPIKVIA